MKVLGVLLIGGASKRYGSPKALAVYEGRTFLDIALENISGVTDKVLALASSKTPEAVINQLSNFDVEVIFDDERLKCRGPLRGLASIPQPVIAQFSECIILGIDYPFLKKDTLMKFIKMSNILDAETSTVLLWREYPTVTLGYAKVDAIERSRKICHIKGTYARLTDLYRCSHHTVLIGWRKLTKDPKEFISVNVPEQLKIKDINISIIENIIDIKENYECQKALYYIEKGEYDKAFDMFLKEARKYEALGIRLFKEHASKDMKYIGEIAGSA